MAIESAEATTATYPHWTADLLSLMPHIEGERYEIVGGELQVTTQPHTRHQIVCAFFVTALNNWSVASGTGIAFGAPGLIYTKDNAVAPDVVWASSSRLAHILGEDGKLHASPELVIEVLSPGKANAERDRETKLALYGYYGVAEYWIADWQAATVELYRRQGERLQLDITLKRGDIITSPLLPGFALAVDSLFAN